MSIISLAIVGRNNKPLYLREFTDGFSNEPSENELFGLSLPSQGESDGIFANVDPCSIRQQFILHEALDRMGCLDNENFTWRAAGAKGSDAMFVGLVYPIEDMRVYGYITTTKVKFVAVVEDDIISDHPIDQQDKDLQIKTLLSKIHNLYIEYTLNPFNAVGDEKIVSDRFDDELNYTIKLFNNEV